VVPTCLIERIAGLKAGLARRCIKDLARNRLITHDNKKYDGYHLTYKGYDYLALKALVNRGHIASIGNQIGCGKESDIFQVADDEGRIFALKLHRLGRTSFRAIKDKRDYLEGRHRTNWFYMSRIAALKEFSYMKALYDRDFKVPIPVDVNRHAVLMQLVEGVPLCQVRELPSARKLLSHLMDFLFRLVSVGLIHCDLNEFNIMVDHDGQGVTVIDFPQMISTSHVNATELFMRDVQGLQTYFAKKFCVEASWKPDDLPQFARETDTALDKELRSSGFSREQQQEFDQMTGDIFSAAAEEESANMGEEAGSSGSESDSDEESEEDELEEQGEQGSTVEGTEEEDAPYEEPPDWVSAELEAQLAAEVGASLAADDAVSEAVREAATLAGTDVADLVYEEGAEEAVAMTAEEQMAAALEEEKEARKKTAISRKVKASLNKSSRQKGGASKNRNKLKGREKSKQSGGW